MEDPPRPQPIPDVKTSHFMVRTSQIFKKVSNFRSQRRKSKSKEVVGLYERGTRSMDLNNKAFMPQNVLAIGSRRSADNSDTPSSNGHTSANAPEPVLVNCMQAMRSPGMPEAQHQESVEAIEGLPPESSTTRTHTQEREDATAAGTLAPRLATLPAPMMARYNAQGAARVTHSMVTRQPPMPLLHLPMLPPPTPTQPERLGRPQAPLRSIPALPMQGPSECEQDADHENAVLGDSDSEEDGEDFADAERSAPAHEADGDEDEDGGSSPERVSPSSMNLPQVATTSSFGASFLDGDPAESRRETWNSTGSGDAQPTPVPKPGFTIDYFNAKDLTRQSSRSSIVNRTPRPADLMPSGSRQFAGIGNSSPLLTSPASPRPGLYHHGSRSMVDLLSVSRKGKEVMGTPTMTADSPRKNKLASAGPPTIVEDEQGPSRVRPDSPEDMDPSSPILCRRRSLPTYKHTSEPPPYPSFHPRGGPPVQPRDEEGKEHLPCYSNSIYLCAIMPRKVEFSKPGEQAKDRKWRRVLCVLDGTVFRVYKCPPSAAGVTAIEAWWENKVGVGDITVINPNRGTSSGTRVSAVKSTPSTEGGDEKVTHSVPSGSLTASQRAPTQPQPVQPSPSPSSRSKFHLAASLLHPNRTNSSSRSVLPSSSTNSRSRLSVDTQREDSPVSPPISSRQSSDNTSSSSRSGYMSNSTSRTTVTVPSPTARSNSNGTSSASSFLRSRMPHSPSVNSEFPPNSAQSIVEPDKRDLISSFTLQHAESGLASDYTKRKNVIRVRLEGEQSLLQAQDIASVIEWIEGIQAATNIALDLDERPMPRGPMFPRRRRRRRPATGHETVQSLRSPRPEGV
ncbi:hypothetical protein BKA93DRAFT_904906 [Sparassis latifolia]